MEQAAAVPVPQTVEDVTEVIRLASQERVDENIVEETVEIIEVEKLDDSCAVKAPAWEEPQRLRAEGSVATHVTNEFLDDCDELIPEWLNFVKGVVDSEDILLSVYRETLLRNKILRVIRKNLAKKYLEYIKGIADSEEHPLNIFGESLRQNKILHGIKKKQVTKYLEILGEIADLNNDFKSYEQFGKSLKPGNDENSTVGGKTAEVLKFKPGDEMNSFKEYVDHMKEEQNDISYIADENTDDVYSFLFEENLRTKGHEELHANEPMDECAVHQFKESEDMKLSPTLKEGLNLGDDDEKKTLEEELKADSEPLTKLMKNMFVDKVGKAMVSDRIVDSPCVLATLEYEYGCSAKIERIMETQVLRDSSMTSHMVSKKNIEVNPTRSIMTELKKKASTWQQQHKSSTHQLTKQPAQREREEGKKGKSKKVEREEWETVVAKGRKGQRGRGQEGRKEEEEKEAEEGGDEQVEKDVTGWTEVTRKRRRKTVQIFVKVDGSRVTSGGGEPSGRQCRGRAQADPKGRGRVCDNARESAEEMRKAEELRSY